jgi:hypothetical protein
VRLLDFPVELSIESGLLHTYKQVGTDIDQVL